MAWPLGSKFRQIAPTLASLKPCFFYGKSSHCSPSYLLYNTTSQAFTIRCPGFGSIGLARFMQPNTGVRSLLREVTGSRLKSSRVSSQLSQESTEHVSRTDHEDSFDEMKQRFLSFKKHKYMKDMEYFKSLAKAQTPKFMVIACADSRVCPSNILGFQPGEAFMIRTVANLVPGSEKGPTETNAALEFAVNNLEVENILVIGHSACGGIQALMSMQDEEQSRGYISHWVANGKVVKLRTKASKPNLSFEQQCRHCEKESINHSLLNLLTYPWIEDRVRKGLLAVYGGYYDILNCTLEKWTIDPDRSSREGGIYLVKDRALWS